MVARPEPSVRCAAIGAGVIVQLNVRAEHSLDRGVLQVSQLSFTPMMAWALRSMMSSRACQRQE